MFARLLLCSVLFFTLSLGHAQSRVDAKGGADHPLISRYTGSWLIGWRKVRFAEVKPFAMLTDSVSKEKKLDNKLTVEGGLTELFYSSPKGRTALEVQRNYEDALKRAGAILLYSCTDRDGDCHRQGGPANSLLLYREVPENQQAGGESYEAFVATSKNLRLSVFTLPRAGAQIYVSVYSVDTPTDIKDFGGAAATYMQIVEPKATELGKVSVFDATQIAKGLSTEGKIALYGIYFDTGKSELKPESAPQLTEMAKLLKQSPAVRVFIVGHTDNQGGFDANMALSQKRAEAVVAALSKEHGIDARRLTARGAANIAPIASNAADTGRAKNRRVELVEQ
jgi:OmpA-OmpF porin, OOP family